MIYVVVEHCKQSATTAGTIEETITVDRLQVCE
jgi:hypothetical protein